MAMGRLDVDVMLSEIEPWQFEEWVEAIRELSPKSSSRYGMMDPEKWLMSHGQHLTNTARRA